MPSLQTEITEIGTALGTLGHDLSHMLREPPEELLNVPENTWERLRLEFGTTAGVDTFIPAFENGCAFLAASDGLRGRRPSRVEWKGPHRAPGDDVIPADLRVDRVYLISCKYLSRVLSNSGPARLFDRLLVGENRSTDNWFATTAPTELQELYRAAARYSGVPGLPAHVSALSRVQQRQLRDTLRGPAWPEPLRGRWEDLSRAVSRASSLRWCSSLLRPRDQLRMFWRLLRITTATYFVLGTDGAHPLRLRVDSAWDWSRAFELRKLEVTPGAAGQPTVEWSAAVRDRTNGRVTEVLGHVEVRWSHGRFNGWPEAKVYLDVPHHEVPGYQPLN